MAKLRDFALVIALVAAGAALTSRPERPPTPSPTPAAAAAAVERGPWRVNGLALGMTEAEVKAVLGPQATSETVMENQVVEVPPSERERYLGPRRCATLVGNVAVSVTGSSLTRRGHLILRSGDSPDYLRRLLGPPKHVKGLDDPQQLWCYLDGQVEIVCKVSNDALIDELVSRQWIDIPSEVKRDPKKVAAFESELKAQSDQLKAKVWEFTLRVPTPDDD